MEYGGEHPHTHHTIGATYFEGNDSVFPMDAITLRQLQNQLTRTQAFFADHQPVLELIIMFGLYSKIMGPAVRYLFSTKRAKAIGLPPTSLILHILVSFIIVGRYYVLQLSSAPVPGRLDLALGLVQAVSSFNLTKHNSSRDTLHRAAFLAMAAMNLVAVVTASVTGSPQWHRVLAKCVDWFTYYRWVQIVILKYHIFGYPKVPATTLTPLVSAPITLWLAGYPCGIPIYFAMLACVMSLNEWVTAQAPNEYMLSFYNMALRTKDNSADR